MMICITSFLCLFIHLITASLPDPCGPGWSYSSTSGKCYKFFIALLNVSQAEASCKSQPSAEVISDAKLAVISDEADMNAVVIAARTNFALQWIGASRSSGLYRWTDGRPISDSTYWSPSLGTGECVSLKLESTNINGRWTIAKYFIPTVCSLNKGYFCEYVAKTCQLQRLIDSRYNSTSMDLVPNRLTIRTSGSIPCKDGFYRESELSTSNPTAPPGETAPNHFECTGAAAANQNPNDFNPILNAGLIETCKAIECDVPNFNVSNVEAQPIIIKNTPTGFSFDTNLTVKCLKGFVNYLESTNTNSAMRCKQSKRQPNKGYWAPGDLRPCVGLRCNLTELLYMEPLRGQILKAVNRRTQITYDGRFQKSELNRFDNVVTIQCNDGYFFETRSPIETIICALKDGSKTEGEWKGYQGTRLPVSKSCKVATCKYQEVVPTETSFFKKHFLIKYPNDTLVRTSEIGSDDFRHNTVIRFWCISDKYESANQNADQNVTCDGQGQWSPQMTACIEKTADLVTNGKRHYQPPTEEAKNAQQIGVVTIVILLLFFGLIIVLDLSTITRDVQILKRNVKNLKLRMHSD